MRGELCHIHSTLLMSLHKVLFYSSITGEWPL